MTLAEMIRQLKTAESISADATVRLRINSTDRSADREIDGLYIVNNTVFIVSEPPQ